MNVHFIGLNAVREQGYKMNAANRADHVIIVSHRSVIRVWCETIKVEDLANRVIKII